MSGGSRCASMKARSVPSPKRSQAEMMSWSFGAFSIADAMYAPVCSRFVTYQVDLDADAKAYVNTMWADPAMAAWVEGARREPWVIEKSEL